jgi:hypothetical protein
MVFFLHFGDPTVPPRRVQQEIAALASTSCSEKQSEKL